MNKCPRCGSELTVEEEESGDIKKVIRKCKKCGFESIDYSHLK